MAGQIDSRIDRGGLCGGTGGVTRAAASAQVLGEYVGETGAWNGPRPARMGRGRSNTSRPWGATTPCGRMMVQCRVLAMGMTMTEE